MRWPARLIAAVLLVLAAGRAGADPYHNAEYKFGVELPPGWRAMRSGELKQVNAVMNRAMEVVEIKYVAGFRYGTGDLGKVPFALVQLDTEPAGMSFDELEKEITRDIAVAKSNARDPAVWARVARRITIEDPVFDRDRKRLTSKGWATQRNPRVGFYSVGCLGPDGLVIVHCFAEEKDFKAHEADFVKLCDSFKFDGEEKPAPAAPPTALDKLFGPSLGPTGQMAIVGAVVAVVVLVFGVLFLRGK